MRIVDDNAVEDTADKIAVCIVGATNLIIKLLWIAALSAYLWHTL